MSHSHTSQTGRRWDLDDATVESIVHGRPVADELEPLVAFAQQVRTAAVDLPGPAPSDELARILRGDDVTLGRRNVQTGRVAAALGKVAGLGAVAKVALGASVAAASVVGAGAVGVLPAAADHAVRHAIEAVTPVDFDRDDKPAHPTHPVHPDNHGGTVSKDATGESDGVKGVDGQKIADSAPGADHRPDPGKADGDGSGQPNSTGLTRANETPAAPHAPDSVPGNGDGTKECPNGDDAVGNCKPSSPPSTVPEHPSPQGNG